MKKLLFLLTIFSFSLLLISCGGDENDLPPYDETVTKIESSLTGNTYLYGFKVKVSQVPYLSSISKTLAVDIYEDIKLEVGTKTMFLLLYFEVDGDLVFKANYQINKNVETPGLSLLKESVIVN